jgi:hypothetical protein
MDKLSIGDANGADEDASLWRPEDDEDASATANKPQGQEWFLDDK